METAPPAQAEETPTEKQQPAEEKPEIEPRPRYSAGVQLTLLDLWGMTEEVSQPKTAKKKKAAKKESPARHIASKPKTAVSTSEAVTENKEAKADSSAKPADPDDIYATLDWDTNPPINGFYEICLLYTSPSPRDGLLSRMPSSA